MIRTPPENTDAEIEAFADLIERLAGFGAQMTPEMADGFLTAVVAARQTVTPEAWLPALAGDAFERAFADPQAHAEGLAILQARLKVIAGQLDPEALLEWPDDLRLSPLVYEYGEDDIQEVVKAGELPDDEARTVLQLGFNWAAGFFAAAEAFPEAWPEPDAEPAEDDADAQVYAQCMAQLMLLTLPPGEFDEAAKELYPEELPSRTQLLDDVCFAVQDLRVHGLDHAPKVATVRHEHPKPGRNDLCPCGSGKKFKKCHGA